MLESQAKIAYLAIGSNLGNKRKNIELAKFKLQNNKIEIIKISNNYETLSWPNKKNPKFINIVLKIRTFLSPYNLLKTCNIIEKELGRKKNNKNEPRTCDIDIIDFNGRVMDFSYKSLIFKVPHEKLIYRNFVLFPLQEIVPNWIHPITKEKISNLIAKLPEEDRKSILMVKKN